MELQSLSPQLSNIANRLASFKYWPAELEMRPEELAEAGFFHDPDDSNADKVSSAIEQEKQKYGHRIIKCRSDVSDARKVF